MDELLDGKGSDSSDESEKEADGLARRLQSVTIARDVVGLGASSCLLYVCTRNQRLQEPSW